MFLDFESFRFTVSIKKMIYVVDQKIFFYQNEPVVKVSFKIRLFKIRKGNS